MQCKDNKKYHRGASMKREATIIEIIEKIKTIISKEKNSDKKIKEIEVANFLKISQNNLAVMKQRGKVPYESIVKLCIKKNISIDDMLTTKITNIKFLT